MKRPRIALGVVTYQRPEYAEKCLRSIYKHLRDDVDLFYVHDDGSSPKYAGAYRRAFAKLPGANLQLDHANKGPAYAKNCIIRHAMVDGADWIFLCEDDLIVKNPWAVTGYLEAVQGTDIHHLSFAHHGLANADGPVESGELVNYYSHSIGAWTLFSRECLEAVGLFDEHFVRAWEHVEHSMRLIRAGYCGKNAAAYKYPDATGSPEWIAEIPGSLERSSIRPLPDWQANIRDGLQYWSEAKPDTYADLFGPGTRLHDYAKRMLV